MNSPQSPELQIHLATSSPPGSAAMNAPTPPPDDRASTSIGRVQLTVRCCTSNTAVQPRLLLLMPPQLRLALA